MLIYEYRWCRDCIDLLISVTYKEADCSTNEDEVDGETIKGEQLPHLTWIKRLKSLAILLGSHSQRNVTDDSTTPPESSSSIGRSVFFFHLSKSGNVFAICTFSSRRV